ASGDTLKPANEREAGPDFNTSPASRPATVFRGNRESALILDSTWAEGTATQGCDRSGDPAAGMAGRRKSPPGFTDATLTKFLGYEARLQKVPLLRVVGCRVVVPWREGV